MVEIGCSPAGATFRLGLTPLPLRGGLTHPASSLWGSRSHEETHERSSKPKDGDFQPLPTDRGRANPTAREQSLLRMRAAYKGYSDNAVDFGQQGGGRG